MTRLFCVAIVVAAVSLAVPVWASVPDPGNSTVAWVNLRPNTDAALICPSGDGPTYLDIVVRDQFNAPMAGVLVEATFDDPPVSLVSSCSGFTNGVGALTLTPAGGVECSGADSTARLSSTTVTCLGVVLYSNDRPFLSPDMNADGTVEGLDYSIFASDWLDTIMTARSNFDGMCPGASGECVEGLDYSIFSVHWLH